MANMCHGVNFTLSLIRSEEHPSAFSIVPFSEKDGFVLGSILSSELYKLHDGRINETSTDDHRAEYIEGSGFKFTVCDDGEECTDIFTLDDMDEFLGR